MKDFSDATLEYLFNSYTPAMIDSIFSATVELDKSDLGAVYEDPVSYVLTLPNLEPSLRRDYVLLALRTCMINFAYEVIGININTDEEIDFNILKSILRLGMMSFTLESYDNIEHILYNELDPRAKAASIAELLGVSKYIYIYPYIAQATNFINTLKTMSEVSTLSSVAESIDKEHNYVVQSFLEYTKNEKSIGATMYALGYINTTLEEMINFLDVDIYTLVSSSIRTQAEQVALDIFSLLVVTVDTEESYIVKFKKYMHYFTSDMEQITLLSSIIINMSSGFANYLYVKRREENKE